MDFKHHPSCRLNCAAMGGTVLATCIGFNAGYQSGLSEGEARATRAIVAHLQHAAEHFGPAWQSVIDEIVAGEHVAAEAEEVENG